MGYQLAVEQALCWLHYCTLCNIDQLTVDGAYETAWSFLGPRKKCGALNIRKAKERKNLLMSLDHVVTVMVLISSNIYTTEHASDRRGVVMRGCGGSG